MSEMSNYLEDALINVTLRNTAYTTPTTVYLALYTTDPTDADTGTEVSGGSYARQAITMGAPSNGVSVSSADISFPQCTVSKAIDVGDIFKVASGSLSVTLS
jgi:hypothetical protein